MFICVSDDMEFIFPNNGHIPVEFVKYIYSVDINRIYFSMVSLNNTFRILDTETMLYYMSYHLDLKLGQSTGQPRSSRI